MLVLKKIKVVEPNGDDRAGSMQNGDVDQYGVSDVRGSGETWNIKTPMPPANNAGRQLTVTFTEIEFAGAAGALDGLGYVKTATKPEEIIGRIGQYSPTNQRPYIKPMVILSQDWIIFLVPRPSSEGLRYLECILQGDVTKLQLNNFEVSPTPVYFTQR
jgi:hypothetical protein